MQLAQTYRRSLREPGTSYRLRLTDLKSARWLVVVHGISREVDGLLRWFGPEADARGYNLLAPCFDAATFPDFQRLGRKRLGARADLALLAVLEDVRALGLAVPARLPLFGFSGGAQFAHRFALAHGAHLSALVCAASGWYTSLTSKLRFPYGIAPTRRLDGLKFRSLPLLSLPTLTLVGAQDTLVDAAVRRRPRLDAEQGITRVQRARWWHGHVCEMAGPALAQRHQLQVMNGCGHGLRDCALAGGLCRRTFSFLQTQMPADAQQERRTLDIGLTREVGR